MVNQCKLKSLLEYSPDTGRFIWRSGKRAGQEAGFGRARGRIQICIAGRNYYAHRLAWVYVNGVEPAGVIDHANGNALDNRIGNLRDTSQSGNLENQRRARRDNSTGLLGVSEKRGKWRAAIKVHGKTKHLGTFASADEAHAAYLAAKRNFHAMCTI